MSMFNANDLNYTVSVKLDVVILCCVHPRTYVHICLPMLRTYVLNNTLFFQMGINKKPVNLIHYCVAFLCHHKTKHQKTSWFTDIFRVYRNATTG